MGRKCNVLDCPSDSRRPEDNGVTFHKMPFHPDIRPKWIELCRIPEERQTNKVIYVCSRHFRRTDFCNFKGTKYMLKQGALPSVFPWTKTLAKPIQIPKNNVLTEIAGIENVEVKIEPIEDEQPTESTEIKIKVEPMEENEEEKLNIKEEIKTEPIMEIKTEPTNSINFLPGTRIEANDFNEKWHPATILEVDYDENEVFVEFDKTLNKANEWIPMDSSRLRPSQPVSSHENFSIGEKVMATWIKTCNKFPATIRKVLEDDSYEVLFDDGFSKILKHTKIAKITSASSSVVKEPTLHASPLFDPVVGSKEERREKKRKLNVAELFGKSTNKRCKTDDYIKSEPEEETQEEFPSTGSSSQCEGEEWTCKWLNGEPVGVVSELEGNEGPRRSIIVADHRLPPGWEKHLTQRQHGNSAGKWDTIIVNPQGKKFTNRNMVRTWIEENKFDYNIDRFDFCLHINRARKLGLYEVTDPEALAAMKLNVSKSSSKSSKGTSKNHKVSTPKSGSTVTLPVTPEVPEPEPEEEDTSHYLKIIHENDSYKCPIDGCGKNFRKENLAQMHIKHYHPEYIKLLGSTPNVADLAYARTVGEHIDDIIPKTRSIGSPLEKEKAVKVETTKPKSTIKVLTPKVTQKTDETDLKKPEKPNASPTTPKPVTKDAEIIRLLNSEPKSKTVDAIFDSPSPKANETNEITNQTIDKYPEIKLKDLLIKAEPIPIKKDEHRPTGIKTLLPVIRNVEEPEPEESESTPKVLPKAVEKLKPGRKRQSSENNDALKKRRQSLKYDTDEMSDFFEADSHSQDSFKDKKNEPSVAPPAVASEVIVEGGEVIRLVHMRSEEIINCTCGITEEDGLMIQCELCLCWQHAHCNNIQKENEVPEKYVCYICKNPQKMRASKKYLHDQDWLKQGTLVTGNYHAKDEELLKTRFEKLRKSHEISGCILELNEYLHNLKIKLCIAENKNHPKLYLWNKPWAKPESQDIFNLNSKKPDEKQEMKDDNLNSSFSGSDHSYIKSSTFGDIALKSMLEPPVEVKTEPPETKLLDEDTKIKSQSELISILEDNEPSEIKSEPTEFPKIDLNSMIVNNLPDKIEIKEENKDIESGLNSIPSGILSTGSLELDLSQTDLERLAQLSDMEANPISSINIPQPEAAIDLNVCRMNLLDHVAFFQNFVEERLNYIETEISELEDQDSGLDIEDTVNDSKNKQTIQMLLRDLNTLRKIASLTN